MALGTVIRDVYTDGERKVMYGTLVSLLRQPNWSSSGLYCYWDPSTKEPLYIGLARNLCTRFAQHNGLGGNKPSGGNKGAKINGWFAENDRLGFSLVLQDAFADEAYDEAAAIGEGQLLEGFKTLHGKLPPWNKIGGSKHGATYAGSDTARWFDFMTGKIDGLVVSRMTIRELDGDPTAEFNEAAVHMSRTAFNFHSKNGKLDDSSVIANLRDHMTDVNARYPSVTGSDLYDIEEIIGYLGKPAPHPGG
ncbi:hypothetical protein HQ325_18265 [Rhodococcus sp. BP-349]|uniref:hypothetical protein n=1 Tax=unclassified Rhodococcus (in: high G+C Gram-positive bacteria) TaxID=192944 RepID=UPI001C9A9E2D|nr:MULTISPECIES: hypothetical protein [unclassified Rhodococcus (in: high G+C Gram-positive bacteria)]MBY6540620.1 hypothetical protein [Rhodococcus sp. BP-363]MBY6545355.1 hypothetical protein [Rhodococcus sp. BP-369]MBY6564585.1 hypothetical protein [Rhodococcus sp. BP-370]MBY6578479.1 hypothetical protein [Rhodococcus sp. BP-364]MBY6587780.1 hypothetical protein [Rhodococcus sp. BP-358]